MEKPPRIGSIELEQDLAFQRTQLRVQHGAWVAMALIVLAALAGAFGSGPLSTAQVQADGLELEYPRLLRLQTPATMQLRLDARQAVEIDRRWVEQVEISRVTPRPSQVRTLADGRLRYEFDTAAGAPLLVSIDFEPQHIGPLRGRAGALDYRQFVFP